MRGTRMDVLPAQLLRSLRVTPDSNAGREAAGLWQEASALVRLQTWQMRLGIESFLDAFHPHARQSKDLARTLEGCPEVWLGAVTIGDALEQRSREYFQLGRPFAGYMLDRMGSFLAEASMRRLHAKVRAQCAQTHGRATRRYSPGYGDFALQAQTHFLRLAGDALPGLQLTSGFLLLPEKSITAVCGCMP